MKNNHVVILNWKNNSNFIIGLGCEAFISKSKTDSFKQIDTFLDKYKKNYLFCCISYDFKNNIENHSSNNIDEMEFPEFYYWKPEVVVELNNSKLKLLDGILTIKQKLVLDQLLKKLNSKREKLPKIKFQSRISKAEYIQNVIEIQDEIQKGNIYEINYCQEFYSKKVPKFNSIALFNEMKTLTNAPFSCYFKLNEFELFCGSPERFIQKKGNKLISQPIKGTIKRGENNEEDERLKNELKSDQKERAENIMITDIVRNDLAKIAIKNSVKVDELCKLYTFGTVHQLISTISCNLKKNTKFSEILKATFPMGSMTGAPKISAMELIEKFEKFKRGLYSGTVGFFEPNGNFDFNVVIRSMIFNSNKNYISCAVGGAITKKSIPENEYEECLVKVKRLIQLFGNDQLK